MVSYGNNGFRDIVQHANNGNGVAMQSNQQVKVQPLLCSGHTRPVVHLQFSNL